MMVSLLQISISPVLYNNEPKIYGVLEVDNIISSIKKNDSIDDISMKFFKLSLFYVAPYIFMNLLTHVYNME